MHPKTAHLSAQASSMAICVLLLSLATARVSPSQDAPEILTNASVVKMVQAHLSPNVIAEQIRTSPGSYILTANSLIRLKQQGVPDTVIHAMQASKHATAAEGEEQQPGAAASTAEEPASAGTLEHWALRTTVTPLTDVRRETIVAAVRGSNHVAFDLEASCEDETSLALFISTKNSRRIFQKTPMARNVSGTTTAVPFTNMAETTGSVSAAQSCIVTQIRVAGDDVKEVISQPCDRDYATITFAGVFSRQRLQQRMQDRMKNDPAIRAQAKLLDFFGMDANSIADIASAVSSSGLVDGAAPKLASVLNATSVRVQLPFTDGSSSVLEFHPQDPSFKAYTAGCLARALPEPAPVVHVAPAKVHPSLVHPRPPIEPYFAGIAADKTAKTYQGTLDGFAAKLPGYLQRAADEIGAPPRSFDQEVAFIVSAARRCASISTDQADSVTRYDYVDVQALGPAYRPCSTLVGTFVPGTTPAQLYLNIHPRGVWGDGKGMKISLNFTQDGWQGSTPLQKREVTAVFGIVYAVLD